MIDLTPDNLLSLVLSGCSILFCYLTVRTGRKTREMLRGQPKQKRKNERPGYDEEFGWDARLLYDVQKEREKERIEKRNREMFEAMERMNQAMQERTLQAIRDMHDRALQLAQEQREREIEAFQRHIECVREYEAGNQ